MKPSPEPLTRREASRAIHAAPAAPAAGHAAVRLPPLLVAMRPKQWIKNGLVFLALLFSIKQAWHPTDIGSWAPLCARALLAFAAFTAVASAEYLINDIRDIESDRLHPRKRRRPLAAGTLGVRTAVIVAAILFVGGAALGLVLGLSFSLVLLIYALQSLAYSY